MKHVSAICLGLMVAGCMTNASLNSAPSNGRLLDDFIYTAFGNTRNTIYKVEGSKACVKVLGNSDAYQRAIVSEAISAYSLNGFLNIGQDDCSARVDLAIVFVPIDVNRNGPQSIWQYAIDELNRVYPNEKIPERVSHLYYTRVAQRYHTPSPDHYWTQQICSFGPSFRHEDKLTTIITISNSFGYMRRCIFEEMLQSLGLPFDSPKYWPSLMNNNEMVGSRFAEISEYDLLYLRILYDPRITSAMTSKQVREAARAILAELRPDETHPPQLERLIHPTWRARQAWASKE